MCVSNGAKGRGSPVCFHPSDPLRVEDETALPAVAFLAALSVSEVSPPWPR